jgi:hypothetical protein
MNKVSLSLLIFFACGIHINQATASRKSSFTVHKASKPYTKKAPYAGLGKKSSANGLIKAKGVSGHFKKTSKGYTFVNPYAKSK